MPARTLPKSQKRSRHVLLNFQPVEFKIVSAASKRANQTVSAWIRTVAVTVAKSEGAK